jgi:hypothetical protein
MVSLFTDLSRQDGVPADSYLPRFTWNFSCYPGTDTSIQGEGRLDKTNLGRSLRPDDLFAERVSPSTAITAVPFRLAAGKSQAFSGSYFLMMTVRIFTFSSGPSISLAVPSTMMLR